MEKEADGLTFEMGSLKINLPKKRGLSMYYSGKARSFTCMADAQSLEDLKKQEHPREPKRRKLQCTSSDRQQGMQVPTMPCRRVSSSTHCTTPCVGA
ncbi:hypothetical protein RJ641_013841 [Dillenia turbinata]|uniref:Uncharacterized protein n=1 Tax=Dillenia turbinata TaxID=194707 RepID=A0AAN8WDF1_9MAGN